MRRLTTWSVAALVLLPASVMAGEVVHHELAAIVEPAGHSLAVTDTVTLPDDEVPAAGGPIRFVLHGGLSPATTTPGVKLVREARVPRAEDLGLKENAFNSAAVPLELYQVVLPAGVKRFAIQYKGELNHPITQTGEEYARDFSETPGTISPDVIYLSGASKWYPIFGDHLLTFSLEAKLPPDWDAVSQGTRTTHDRPSGATIVKWDSAESQDEIYLVGAKFTEYDRDAGGVQAMAFLRAPDPDLARKYLDATAQYLEMYSRLIGPYAYTKFALVENYWETGYGMPSFTLLGEKIIRFPFILTSSYPHEILHNWWGNSVYVDYEKGNWCEGLTAFLSDLLLQEQRGEGVEYRQTTLQKYTDFVSAAKDFPLSKFTQRRSSATEAVGYGKSLMFFHMLRLELGDEAFVHGLREFYRQEKFQVAGWDDLRLAFLKASGRNLANEFDQWVKLPGAPKLKLGRLSSRQDGDGTIVSFTLEQMQPGAAYVVHVPVAVTLEGRERAFQTTVETGKKKADLEVRVPGKPLRIDVDPELDVFRSLDRNEIPPALSGVFGAEQELFIVPSSAPKALQDAYRQLAESWGHARPGKVLVKLDTQVNKLPADRAIWVLGWENRFLPDVKKALAAYDITIGAESVRIGKTVIPATNHSLTVTGRNPANPAVGLGWIAADSPAPLPGLGRKLPHYSKYSYLGFEGDEPTNIVKGRWPVVSSPLTGIVSQGSGAKKVERAKLAARTPLADLPPVYSKEALVEDIRTLSAPELKGRGFGTAELEKAADYIAQQFREAGLKPAGDTDGSYFQAFKERGGDPKREAQLKNVIGIIPGSKPDLAGQSIVIAAHYDHLGLGWPGARAGEKGQVHPGADDNASGVGVLLELARVLGHDWTPDRTVVFAAFTGEEADLLGSRYYTRHEQQFPVAKCIAMVNLDTVGRLGKNKLEVLGTGSAREWMQIFMGVGYVTGVQVESVANDLGSSDQKSFLDAGVPAVQLFSGPNLDYHRPTDTADKIDPDGLVKVAAVAKETVDYLARRTEPLTSSLSAVAAPAAATEQRKVSLGTVPDFTYSGEGVKLSGVSPGSPAEKAGLKQGDVILKVNQTPIKDLRELSNVLKSLHPGDKVRVTYTRGDQEATLDAAVEAR